MAEPEVVVVGAGVMGHGIAQVAICAGLRTALVDLDEEALTRGRAQVRQNMDKAISLGKLTESARDEALALLRVGTDLSGAVAHASFVIEAVPEEPELKRSLFCALDEDCPAETILATNTSSLSVTGLAAATGRPDRVIGTHFFNPPYIVRLMGIVTGVDTSEETLQRTRELGKRLGREMIEVRDSPGFATSRLGLVLGLEAIRMVEQGVASAADIDRAMELGYRHPMGPLKLTDLVGLDTRLKIAEYLHAELGGEQFRPPPLLRQMVRAGRLGKKSGRGFYEW